MAASSASSPPAGSPCRASPAEKLRLEIKRARIFELTRSANLPNYAIAPSRPVYSLRELSALGSAGGMNSSVDHVLSGFSHNDFNSDAMSVATSDPFALVNASLARYQSAQSKKDLRKIKDPQDPAAQAYLRARYPDFDEYLACLETVDYKYTCEHDAGFASKYRIPDTQEPIWQFTGHLKGVDSCRWIGEGGKKFVSGGHDGIRVWAEGGRVAAGVLIPASCFDSSPALFFWYGCLGVRGSLETKGHAIWCTSVDVGSRC